MPMSTSTYATNFNLVCWVVGWVVQMLVVVAAAEAGNGVLGG